jgi:hypothetical protein
MNGEGGGVEDECVLVRLIRTEGLMKGRQGVGKRDGGSALKYEPGRLGGGCGL